MSYCQKCDKPTEDDDGMYFSHAELDSMDEGGVDPVVERCDCKEPDVVS